MKKNKVILIIVVLAILLAVVYVMNGKITTVPQQVVPSGQECTTYAQCSALLQQQGYNHDQINSYLTVCDEKGCRLIS